MIPSGRVITIPSVEPLGIVKLIVLSELLSAILSIAVVPASTA